MNYTHVKLPLGKGYIEVDVPNVIKVAVPNDVKVCLMHVLK